MTSSFVDADFKDYVILCGSFSVASDFLDDIKS